MVYKPTTISGGPHLATFHLFWQGAIQKLHKNAHANRMNVRIEPGYLGSDVEFRLGISIDMHSDGPLPVIRHFYLRIDGIIHSKPFIVIYKGLMA